MARQWHLDRPSAFTLTFVLDSEALKCGWGNPVFGIADKIPAAGGLWEEGAVLPVTPEEKADLETRSPRYTLRLYLDCPSLPAHSPALADWIKAHFRMAEDKGYESIWRMPSASEEGSVFLWKAEATADRLLIPEKAPVIERQLLDFDRKWFSHILGEWSIYADKPAVFMPFMKPNNGDIALSVIHMAEALRTKDKGETDSALHNGWHENSLKTWFRLVYPLNAPWDWKKEENGQLLPSMLASCASGTPLYWDGEFAYGTPLERKPIYGD